MILGEIFNGFRSLIRHDGQRVGGIEKEETEKGHQEQRGQNKRRHSPYVHASLPFAIAMKPVLKKRARRFHGLPQNPHAQQSERRREEVGYKVREP